VPQSSGNLREQNAIVCPGSIQLSPKTGVFFSQARGRLHVSEHALLCILHNRGRSQQSRIARLKLRAQLQDKPLSCKAFIHRYRFGVADKLGNQVRLAADMVVEALSQ